MAKDKNKTSGKRELRFIYGYNAAGKRVIFLLQRIGNECWGLWERIGVSSNSFHFTSGDSYSDKWYYECPKMYLEQDHTTYQGFRFEYIEHETYLTIRNTLIETGASLQLFSTAKFEDYENKMD